MIKENNILRIPYRRPNNKSGYLKSRKQISKYIDMSAIKSKIDTSAIKSHDISSF